VGVGQQVAHDPLELTGASDQYRRPAGLHLDDPPRSPPAGLGRLLDQGSEVDLLLRFVGGPRLGGQLDHLGHEVRQLGQLDLGPVEQPGPLLGRQSLTALEQLDRRAQARERGPQLVAGVEHALMLLAAGRVEAAEHRVEGPGERADLVLTADRHRLGEVLRRGHPVGGRAQPAQWGRRLAGHEPADRTGDDAAGAGDHGQLPGQAVEHVAGLGQAPPHHQRPTVLLGSCWGTVRMR
jgi:hypothetical protein